MLPDAVLVGATRYTVESRDRKLFGRTDNRHSTIMVSSRQSGASARDTLLHEVLHAILWCSAAGRMLPLGDEDEERLVRLLTPWLLAVIRDNPELIDYLIAEGGDPE